MTTNGFVSFTLGLLICGNMTFSAFSASPAESARAKIYISRSMLELAGEIPRIQDRPPRQSRPQGVPQQGDAPRAAIPVERAGDSEIDDPYLAPAYSTSALQSSVIVLANGVNKQEVGSGTAIRSEGGITEILSVAHLTAGIENASHRVSWSGKMYPAKLIRVDRRNDLALYTIEESIAPVEMVNNVLKGSPVFSVGLNAKSGMMSVIGQDNLNEPHCVVTNGQESGGRSGGGLFNSADQLVGVTRAVMVDGSRSFYVDIPTVRRFLAKPLPPEELPAAPQATPPTALEPANVAEEQLPPPPTDDAPQIDTSPIKLQSMRLNLSPPPQAVPGQSAPFRAVTIKTVSCTPCRQIEALNGKGNSELEIEYIDYDHLPKNDKLRAMFEGHAFPVTCWLNASGETLYIPGVVNTDQILTKIKKPDNQPVAAATRSFGARRGFAGTIQAGYQIDQLFAFWAKHIGPGNEATFAWMRNGNQAMNLLHAQQWKFIDIFGNLGRFELAAPQAVNLPIKSAGFGYQILPDGTPKIDFDSFTLSKSFVDQFVINDESAAEAGVMMSQPMGIIGIDDIAIASSVFGIIKSIFSLLWPQVDVMAPPTISAKASMTVDGDVEKITVNFLSAPSVRIKVLWTTNLMLESVEITRELVRLNFTGSWFIKSKDFAIQR